MRYRQEKAEGKETNAKKENGGNSCASPALALHQGSVQGSGGLRMPRFGVLILSYFLLIIFCFFFASRGRSSMDSQYDDDLRALKRETTIGFLW